MTSLVRGTSVLKRRTPGPCTVDGARETPVPRRPVRVEGTRRSSPLPQLPKNGPPRSMEKMTALSSPSAYLCFWSRMSVCRYVGR